MDAGKCLMADVILLKTEHLCDNLSGKISQILSLSNDIHYMAKSMWTTKNCGHVT